MIVAVWQRLHADEFVAWTQLQPDGARIGSPEQEFPASVRKVMSTNRRLLDQDLGSKHRAPCHDISNTRYDADGRPQVSHVQSMNHSCITFCVGEAISLPRNFDSFSICHRRSGAGFI